MKKEKLKETSKKFTEIASEFKKCMKGRIAFFDAEEKLNRKNGFWVYIRIKPTESSGHNLQIQMNPSEKELDLSMGFEEERQTNEDMGLEKFFN